MNLDEAKADLRKWDEGEPDVEVSAWKHADWRRVRDIKVMRLDIATQTEETDPT